MMRQPEISYRPDIDGLRGIAILSVVAYHVGLPWITGGFTGVDVFFVISGFLITQLLLKEAQSSGTISIANFYARRVRRLLPALATVMAVTLIGGALFLPHFGERQALAKSACASLVFAANQYFLSATGGYFEGPSELQPLLHLWSLSVEEQFYLVWPLILIAVVKLSRMETRIGRVRILIGGLLAGSFLISLWLLRTHPQAAFFVLPSRAWELGVGALLATVPPNTNALKQRWLATVAGVSGLVLLAWAFFTFNAATPFPGFAAVVPVIGSALLIIAGMGGSGNFVSRLLSLKPMVTVGLLSYSWYLWHWPLLSIVRNRRIVESNVAVDCLIALIAFVCAALTVRFIETPIRHHKGAPVARRTVLIGGLTALTALLICSVALGAYAKYGPQLPYPETAQRERPPLENVCMSPKRAWDPRCVFVPKGRTIGETPLAVIWGDSHADSWAATVRTLAAADQLEMRELSHGSCPPLLDTTISTSIRTVSRCRPYNTEVIEGLRKLRQAAPLRKIGVVLSARWPGYLGTLPIPLRDSPPLYPRYYSDRKGGATENLTVLHDGLRRTLVALKRMDIRVLILLGGPEFRVPPVLCADLGYTNKACDQTPKEIASYRGATVATIARVAAEFANVRVVDPMPFFCTEDSCPGFMKQHPVVYDDSHISLFAAKAYSPTMRPDFRWLFASN